MVDPYRFVALPPNRSRSQFIGLSRIYQAMWRPEISGPYLPIIADHAVPTIALPYGSTVRQRSIRRSADAHYGGPACRQAGLCARTMRPNDSWGTMGMTRRRCGRGWWVAVGAANSPPRDTHDHVIAGMDEQDNTVRMICHEHAMNEPVVRQIGSAISA